MIGTIVACPYEETNHCKRAEVDEDRLCCICLSEMEPDEEAKELMYVESVGPLSPLSPSVRWSVSPSVR